MNQTLKDIHWMLARIWLGKDGISLSAYDEPYFKTLAERYGFTYDTYEECLNIVESEGKYESISM